MRAKLDFLFLEHQAYHTSCYDFPKMSKRPGYFLDRVPYGSMQSQPPGPTPAVYSEGKLFVHSQLFVYSQLIIYMEWINLKNSFF